MASTTSSFFFESLPYIDPQATAESLAKAKALIDAEASSSSSPSTEPQSHPRVPPLETSRFLTDAMKLEDERVSSSSEGKKPPPLKAIDLSRYQAVDAASLPPYPSDPTPETLRAYNAALSAALATTYSQASHVAQKSFLLSLLSPGNDSKNGPWASSASKNSWLLSNYHAEAQLGSLERELAETKREVDRVNIQRKEAQDAVGEEMRLLERDWKAGVGKVLEIEVAIERLRREGDELRRMDV
ncbi:hypothetical protein MKZ38_008540 [Zalerion maritima]|uniref:Pre-mRNA-splicing factor SPF27 n=1 Tax=Zalerion maritima TaxID=339359 RepID=A0AAD5RVR9_9PEZI|nr:hypothetical protein MKZ38_008540 [Zalerion maritima]